MDKYNTAIRRTLRAILSRLITYILLQASPQVTRYPKPQVDLAYPLIDQPSTMLSPLTALTLALTATTTTAKILWDGRANGQTSSAFLSQWSWSNQVGPYQYYIHGPEPVTRYVKLQEGFKSPHDAGSKRGFQLTVDSTSKWNGQSMLRTELIPQTTAPINKGKVFYHFSMQYAPGNAAAADEEHQICFFESHFTEMRFNPGSRKLHWYADGKAHWTSIFDLSKGLWHNIAYGIDFDAGTVTYYHSTGAEKLEKLAGPIKVSASSNGQDWHLGVLRLPSQSGAAPKAENWKFSGVYIEDGPLTLKASSPGGAKARK